MKVSSPIPKKRARIEIIPLIDIMFFLLASFMMVSLSQTHMKGIRVALPSPVAPQTQPDLTVVNIQVLAGDATYINRQFVPDDQVLSTLYQLHQSNPDVKVSISADKEALHGDVITLLDRVRSAQITKIGYQIRAAPSAPH
ncbi:MAG TPA: biopolymer transporter ExbD [Chthoniobacterales bacterium]|jgi:Biopolymer transport protein|nr:biopolymer transporter ExbD [Chthoniobacterales bacterium]